MYSELYKYIQIESILQMSKYKFKINYMHANSYKKKEQYFLSILEYI